MSNNLAKKFKQKIEQSEISKIPEAEVVSNPQVVQVMEVEVPAGDLEVIRNRHEESLRKFPQVKIDDDEYVVMSLRRHWIGLLGVFLTTFILFVLLVSAWILICYTPNRFEIPEQMKTNLSLIFAPLSALVLVAGYIGYSTYVSNKLFVTNERVVQWIVKGLLERKSQVINLEAIEDIGFSQSGLLQHIFNYGTVRMSTTGDESTYTFNFASFPAKTVEILGEIAECSRENQPISDEVMNSARQISSK